MKLDFGDFDCSTVLFVLFALCVLNYCFSCVSCLSFFKRSIKKVSNNTRHPLCLLCLAGSSQVEHSVFLQARLSWSPNTHEREGTQANHEKDIHWQNRLKSPPKWRQTPEKEVRVTPSVATFPSVRHFLLVCPSICPWGVSSQQPHSHLHEGRSRPASSSHLTTMKALITCSTGRLLMGVFFIPRAPARNLILYQTTTTPVCPCKTPATQRESRSWRLRHWNAKSAGMFCESFRRGRLYFAHWLCWECCSFPCGTVNHNCSLNSKALFILIQEYILWYFTCTNMSWCRAVLDAEISWVKSKLKKTEQKTEPIIFKWRPCLP